MFVYSSSPEYRSFYLQRFLQLLPPMVEAQELVGSVCKNKAPIFFASLIASDVTTPDSSFQGRELLHRPPRWGERSMGN